MALPLSRRPAGFLSATALPMRAWAVPEAVGTGYVRDIRDWLRASVPARAPQILNKGISGNTIQDLRRRWKSDVLAHEPQLVSIKIGINDVWHGLGEAGGGTSIENFERLTWRFWNVSAMRFRKSSMVLCEPTVIGRRPLPQGNKALAPYVMAVREIGAIPSPSCGAASRRI